mgnify:CR=1 FL=1
MKTTKRILSIILCLAMVIGSGLLELFLPGTVKKTVPEKNEVLILQRLQSKVDPETCEASLRSGILKERKTRKLHNFVTVLLLVIGSILFLIYALNGNNFHQREITESLVQAMYLLIPCMAVPFGYGLFTSYYAKATNNTCILRIYSDGRLVVYDYERDDKIETTVNEFLGYGNGMAMPEPTPQDLGFRKF